MAAYVEFDRERRPTTLRDYRHICNRDLLPIFGALPLRAMSSALIDNLPGPSHRPGSVQAADDQQVPARKRIPDPEVREEYERVASSEPLGRIVIARRGELGLTQAVLARRMGTTASVISRVESGQHAIGARTLSKRARALEAGAVVGFDFGSVAAPERQLVVP